MRKQIKDFRNSEITNLKSIFGGGDDDGGDGHDKKKLKLPGQGADDNTEGN